MTAKEFEEVVATVRGYWPRWCNTQRARYLWALFGNFPVRRVLEEIDRHAIETNCQIRLADFNAVRGRLSTEQRVASEARQQETEAREREKIEKQRAAFLAWLERTPESEWRPLLEELIEATPEYLRRFNVGNPDPRKSRLLGAAFRRKLVANGISFDS